MALFSCTTHVVDIGGLGQSPDGRQVFHEGLFLPLLPLMREGKIDESVMRIVRANVREPVQVEGDFHALIGCNGIGEKPAVRHDDRARHRLSRRAGQPHHRPKSRAGMVAAIGKLPRGTWKGHMRIDGYDAPIDLHAAVTINADHIAVDYAGTSGSSIYGINSPMCYTEAYTAFGIKCVVAPTIPNNAGTLDSILVTAPDNTIVNALWPAAVNARSTIGHMLPDVCFDALHQVIPGRVPAEGTSNLWNLKLGAGHGMTGTIGNSRPFMVTTFHSGGAGARPTLDGLSATPFPSGVRNVPVEITETIAPDRGVEEGIPPGFRRRRPAPRRARPGDGARASRGRAVRHLRHLRAGQVSGARTRRRPARRQWPAVARLGPGAAGPRASRPSRPASGWWSRCRAAAGSATPPSATAPRSNAM